MKTYLLSIMMLCFSFAIHANTIRVYESKINTVNLYQNYARIERDFDVKLKSGLNFVILQNVSPHIVASSISASGSGDAVIYALKHEQSFLNEENINPEIQSLQDSLDLLNASLTTIRNKKSSISEHILFLNSHKNTKADNATLKVSDLEEVGNFLQAKLFKLNNQLVEESKKEKELNEIITRINNEINKKRKSNKISSNIVITINAITSGNAKLNVDYVVSNCGWIPSYDLTVLKVKDPVKLTLKSILFQNSGEDWNDVMLTISTGDPSLNQTKPILYPWYLQFVEYSSYIDSYQKRLSKPRSVQMDNLESVQTMAPASMGSLSQSITQAETQLFSEFKIPVKYTIANGTGDLQIELSAFILEASYKYFCIPKLDRDAFLLASVTGWEDQTLLPGMASIRFENRYIGESFIDPLNTNDTLIVSLGRDKMIQVERKLLKNKKSSQWIGSSKSKTFEYEIKAKNIKSAAIELEIADQVPVSSDSDIEVRIIDLSGAQHNLDKGELIWNFSLKPQESQAKKFSFTVKYPKNKIVPGL
ncbi:MAG TPA: DUF4139 domain-containing protein [Bacteroidia bacterium]|nr:DUF4139 domain-containing protein [Bacteroidia bacterium]